MLPAFGAPHEMRWHSFVQYLNMPSIIAWHLRHLPQAIKRFHRFIARTISEHAKHNCLASAAFAAGNKTISSFYCSSVLYTKPRWLRLEAARFHISKITPFRGCFSLHPIRSCVILIIDGRVRARFERELRQTRLRAQAGLPPGKDDNEVWRNSPPERMKHFRQLFIL